MLLGASAIVLGAVIAAAASLASVSAQWAEPEITSLKVKRFGIETKWEESGLSKGLMLGSEVSRSLTGYAGDWESVTEVEAGTYRYADRMRGVTPCERDSGTVWLFRVRFIQQGPDDRPHYGEWSGVERVTIPEIPSPQRPQRGRVGEDGDVRFPWHEPPLPWSSNVFPWNGFAIIRSVHVAGAYPADGEISFARSVHWSWDHAWIEVDWPENPALELSYAVVSYYGDWFSPIYTARWFDIPSHPRDQ